MRSHIALRIAIAAAGIFAAVRFAGAAPGEDAAGEEIELIRDPHFRLGVKAYAPEPGKKVILDTFAWNPDGAEPVWGMAQWSSRFPLAAIQPQTLPDGATRYANSARAIAAWPGGAGPADLALHVDSRPEWNGTPRAKGQAWPHLLVEQRLNECPPLVELAALRFQIDAKLLRHERFELPGYDPRLHAAQFLIFFTVQDLNRDSAGFGDFLWLGAPVFDDRHAIPPRLIKGDAGSGKMIFNPGGEAYGNGGAAIGHWIELRADLLPLALESIREAWDRGFLSNSRNLQDFRLGGMNMGWEVTGIDNSEMAVRNLRLTAVKRANPSSSE